MKNSRLIVVGSGIKFLSHMTVEVKAAIEQSDRVLYLVNEPAMKVWIKEHAKKAESLDPLYGQQSKRKHSYANITRYILEALVDVQTLCVVLYGHPSVFATPALEAVRVARADGVDCQILPGISAEDCLFADLAIDPGDVGCLSFEASYFLLKQVPFSIHSHLVLWQPAVIGVQGHAGDGHDPRPGLALLTHYLGQYYPDDHELTVYQAAQYPQMSPHIENLSLSDLARQHIPRLATLYIPPQGVASLDPDIKQAFLAL